MITPINPEGERIRAQSILRSFTEHQKAVNLFEPMSPERERIRAQVETAELATNANRNKSQSIMRAFKAIKLNLWGSTKPSGRVYSFTQPVSHDVDCS